MSYKRSIILFIVVVIFAIGTLFVPRRSADTPAVASNTSQVSSSSAAVDATSSASTAPHAISTAPSTTARAAAAPIKKTNSTATKPDSASATTSNQVSRVKDAYTDAPQTFSSINVAARSSLVNILCLTSESSLKPISGSGVMIDPRGVVLTNAHVAQYILLAESGRVNLSCTIRTDSPARARWTARVLYMPSVWVQAHASEITSSHPVGTGEHDYALLFITGSVDGSPLPTQFSFTAPDTREAIGFLDDSVLAASYPAEFLGGFQAENNLYAASSVTTIKQLMTFATRSIDVISLGGVLEAQSGSSGGAIVNAWDRLIGLITTTSEGATTADRDLHAITLSYIDRDLVAQTGSGLTTLLSGDLTAKTATFTNQVAPQLIQLFITQLSK